MIQVHQGMKNANHIKAHDIDIIILEALDIWQCIISPLKPIMQFYQEFVIAPKQWHKITCGRQGLLVLRCHLDSLPIIWWRLCCSSFLVFCVVFLFGLSLSCVPNVDSFSGLSILDCPFGFLYRLRYSKPLQ